MERIDAKSVETTANYEGNATLLLLERVKNPVIRSQILDLLSKSEYSMAGELIGVWQTDADGNFLKNSEGNPFTKEVPYTPRSPEELEKDFDEAVTRAESVTGISFDTNPHASSNEEVMKINSIAPWNGKPFNEKQMGIAEAHEKGHNIRPYDSPFFETYFEKALRFDTGVFTKEDIEVYKKALDGDDQKKSEEEILALYIDYMSSAKEVAERMSQLKNYFGMSGDDIFTREHLHYAREHYVKDTGLDNGMAVFFRAIKPDTEDEFLRLINCSGI